MKHAFHPADQRGRFGQSHTRDGDSAPAWSTGIAAIDACLPGEGLNRCGLHEIEPLSPTDMPSLTGFGFALLSRFGSGLPIIWCVTAQQIGMMGRASQLIDQVVDRSFVVLPFVVDDRIPARITTLVDQINGDEPDLSGQEVNVREFTLDMNVSSNGMMGGMMGGMGINGRGFDMSRIDFNAGLGTIEKWIVSTDMLAHPFHIHGVSFQVLKENNGQPKSESGGWKDTVVVDGTSELLVKFGMPASVDNPFMYHCHILEHEDNGMMGQFTVS